MANPLDRNQLFSFASRHRDEYETLLKRFVETPTVSCDPSHAEDIRKGVDLTVETMQRFGGKVDVFEVKNGNPTVYGVFGTDKKLPSEITAGLDSTQPNLIERRKAWNKPAPGEYALPTETWREVVVRRQRYEEVRKRLAAGEVREINDFITLNLDLRQFAQDVIQNCEGPDLLMAFWQAITTITVLDPTGGSGALRRTLAEASRTLGPASTARQVFDRQLAPLDRMDALRRLSVDLRERRAQDLVPAYDLVERRFEQCGIELASEAQCSRHVVG